MADDLGASGPERDPDSITEVTLVDLEAGGDGTRSRGKSGVTAVILLVVVALVVAAFLVMPGEEEPAQVAIEPTASRRSILAIRTQGDVVELSADAFEVDRTIWSPPPGGLPADGTVSTSTADGAVYFTVVGERDRGPTIWRSQDGDAEAIVAGTLPAPGPSGMLAYVDPAGPVALRRDDGSTSSLDEPTIVGPILRWSPNGLGLLFNRPDGAAESQLVLASSEPDGSPPHVVLRSTQPTGVVADFLDDDRLVVAGDDSPTEVTTLPVDGRTASVGSTMVASESAEPSFRIAPDLADRIVDLTVDRTTGRVLVVSERDGDEGAPTSTLWVWSTETGLRVVGDGYRAANWGTAEDPQPEPSETTTVAPPSETTIVIGDCSAAIYGNDPIEPQEGLPEVVQQTRTDLIEAATACDWDRLLDLRMPDPGWYLDFDYEVGAPQYELNMQENREQLAELRAEDESGRRPLVRLVEALRGSYFCNERNCLWLASPTTSGGDSDDERYYESRSLEVGIGAHGSWNQFWPLDYGTLPSNIFDCVPDVAALERTFNCGYVGPPPQQDGSWPADWPKLYWGGSWDEP